MIRVQSSININRKPEEVFAYIANFENNPAWQAGMIEAHFTSEPPLAVGSTYTQVAKFMGRRVDSNFTVLEYEPNRLVKIATTSGSFPITVTRTVTPDGASTLVEARIEGDATGFFKIAEPLMRIMVQRSVDADYRQLKNLLESMES